MEWIFIDSSPFRHQKPKTNRIVGFQAKRSPYISSGFYSNSLKEKCWWFDEDKK